METDEAGTDLVRPAARPGAVPQGTAGSGAVPQGTAGSGSGVTAGAADGAGSGDLGRVLTVPNLVTTVRLACIPLFVWLLFGAHDQVAASVLLAVTGATDWADGTLARRLGQVSTLGKVLDPTADRLLVATAVVCTVVAGAVPAWFAGVTLGREALVSVAVVVLAALGAERIDVLWVGKAGTFGLMFAYPAFLLSHGPAPWQSAMHVVAWVGGVAGLVLAWVAAAAYVPHARRALVAGRGRGGRGRGAGVAAAPGGDGG